MCHLDWLYLLGASAQQGESGGTTGSAVSHCCRGGATNAWSHDAGGRGAGDGETFEWTQEVNRSLLGNSTKPLLASLAAATLVPTLFVPCVVTFIELPPQASPTGRQLAQLSSWCLIVVFSSVEAKDQRSQCLRKWQCHLHIVEYKSYKRSKGGHQHKEINIKRWSKQAKFNKSIK